MNTLIERLRGRRDLGFKLANDAADALEFKDSEIERLTLQMEVQYESDGKQIKELQDKLDALQKQEPVYQYKRGDGSWIDQTQTSYENNVKHGAAEVRIVYAAPVVSSQQKLDEIKARIDAAVEENFGRCPNEKWFGDLIDRRDALERQLKAKE